MALFPRYASIGASGEEIAYMKHIVEFPMENGDVLLVEVDDVPGAYGPGSGQTMRGVSSGEMMERARLTYEEAVDKIRPAAESIVERIRSIAEPPDIISVEFGIKLNANIGAILASASTEAQFTLTLTWNRAAIDELHAEKEQTGSEPRLRRTSPKDE